MTKKIEVLGLWEQIYHPGVNPVEFDGVRVQAGLNHFTLTVPNLIDIQQMKLLTADERTPQLPEGKKGK